MTRINIEGYINLLGTLAASSPAILAPQTTALSRGRLTGDLPGWLSPANRQTHIRDKRCPHCEGLILMTIDGCRLWSVINR
jgi:hypothetical protein